MIKTSKISEIACIIKQLPAPTVFVNRDLNIVYASNSWIKKFDQDFTSTVNPNIYSLFPDLDKKWKTVFNECLSGNPRPMGIQSFTGIDGEKKWFEWTSSPWFNNDEDIIGGIIQTHEVTNEIRNEIAFTKMESFLKQQTDHSKIGRWEFFPSSKKVVWCNVTKEIHEVSLSYEPNFTEAILFYKEGSDREIISNTITEALNNGTSWNLTLKILTKKNNEKWVKTTGRPIFSEGDISSFIGTFQDVTSQISNENRRKYEENLIQTLIDHLPLNIYIKDIQSRKILVNKAECDYMGVEKASELIGKSDWDLYPPEQAKISIEEDLKVMKTLKALKGLEITSTRTNGSKTNFLISKIPLVNEDGEATGLIGMSMDITEIKKKEKKLQKVIEISTLQRKKLFDFAHIISHNLRSHTANFSMLLKFMVNEKNEDEKLNIYNMLLKSSHSLTGTIDTLNQIVTLDTSIDHKKETLFLKNKIDGIKKGLSKNLKLAGIKTINKIHENTQVTVVTKYLDNILNHLISNSIKFKNNDKNCFIIFSSYQDKEFTVLSIEDNGIGIDLERHNHKIFGMHKTFHNSHKSRGTGLFIIKNQIEAMNGRITVESKLGIGTTFKIFFK